MLPGAICVAKPTPMDTTSKASSGCIFRRETMSATSTRTLANAVSNSCISKGVIQGVSVGLALRV
ncbi:hypothetical protein D3C78_1737470 [compost metagenome]